MKPPFIYLVAGEPSGDLLGARLMQGLRTCHAGTVEFAGIGGEAMREAGLVSLFPQADLAVMGLAEVLPRIPRILTRLEQTVADIVARKPDAIVTIDSWGFTGRLLKRLKARGITTPCIHFVAPMVWAWKEKRARQLVGRVDLLMCLLPNEPIYFERVGVKAVHVGHPVLESGADKGNGSMFRAQHDIAETAPILCVLPGSRRSEISRLLPVFGEAVANLATARPTLHIALPTVETVAEEVAHIVSKWRAPVTVVRGTQARYDAFAASHAALAASGTVTLELAMAKLPMAVAYRASPLTAMIVRRLVRIKHVSMPNILTDREIVPEFLQENCRATLLVPTLSRLLDDETTRAEQQKGLADALHRLGQGGESPSLRAAREVLKMIEPMKRSITEK